MGKILMEFETDYNVGDVVIFEKNDTLNVGVVEGYYVDDRNFWFNIRITPDFVYTYSNGGDIAEWDIIGVVDDSLKEECYKKIVDGD